MSTSEASKNGKNPTSSVGPPEGSGGSHTSRLENHNESFGDHKPEDKTSVGPPGDSGGSHSVGSSSSSEKHDGSGRSSDDKVAVPDLQESEAAKEVKRGKTPLPPSPSPEIHVPRNAQPPAANQQDSCGPWGGPGGDYWDDDELSSGIKEIWLKITPKVGIASIQIGYADADPHKVKWKENHGKTEDNIPQKKDESPKKVSDVAKWIPLEYPKEKLTRISGSFGSIISEDYDNGKIIIKSLTFHTNNPDKPHGPYGCVLPGERVAENSSFDSKDQGEVVGFNGRSCGKYLHAIGVRTKKKYLSPGNIMKKVGLDKIINTRGK